MPVTTATSIAAAAEQLATAPSPVVAVPVYNSFGDVVRCLEAVDAHTPVDHAVLVVDDGGADRRFAEVLDAASPTMRRRIVVLRHETNVGFVDSCNDAFAATTDRDVVLLNSDVIVGPQWLDRLTAAALSSDTIATASALTNHGTILSIPSRNQPANRLPDDMTAEEAAERVAAQSLQLRPTIPTAIGHCCYIRRLALDLVGGFDPTFSPGYGEEVDFSQRAIAAGLRHICADDVFVYHRGGASFGSDQAALARQAEHEEIVNRRYPWYRPARRRAEEDLTSTLADSLAAGRRALVGLTAGVDALCLGPVRMGTQEVTVETLRALAAHKDIKRLVAFVPPGHAPYVHELREELGDVEFVGVNPVAGSPLRVVDVLYRPYQVSALAELDFLRHAADRFVVNQLDTIAFENPAYFARDADWLAYRDLTRLVFDLADGVAFLSERSRSAAAAQGLLADGTPTAVVSCGIVPADAGSPVEQPLSRRDIRDGYVLCMGTSYLHKNRPFALAVWAALRRRGWTGQIVLAGPTPPHGDSLADEAEFLLRHAELRDDVVTLGAVADAEKRWLYDHAALVLYPSTIEGFGLIPFEAAGHGTPVLATRQGSLDETLPTDIPTIARFDVEEVAEVAWTLLHDPAARAHVVDALRRRSRTYDWAQTADRVVDLLQQSLQRPRRRAITIEGEGSSPIGIASRPQAEFTAATGEHVAASLLERVVSTVIEHPAIKNGLSPNGSRRQLVARRAISLARRQLR